MAQSDFIPSLWTARIETNTERLNVFAQIVTTQYQGVLAYGNSVTLLTPKDVTVREYQGSVIWEQADANKIELKIDRRPYFAVRMDDLTVIQSNLDLLDQYSVKASAQLAGEVEKEVVAKTAATPAITVTSANLFNGVAQAASKLNAARYGRSARWLTVSSDLEATMLTDTRFVTASDEARQTGVIGRVLGFDVYSSPEIPVATALYGVNGALAIAGGVEEIQSHGFEDSFDVGIKGYYAFGVKVVETNGVGRIVVDETP